ncbi:hypothetical protein [Desulfosporosinus sp. BICA1-9]|uniref:hypothetical protein n=1 Tax=Desulfosporosinus sp. BICA1-9 TaxID=1531958 RepID=UPI00054B3C3B|nr:hypothetical protein [Desulfosporosinus sp. BICA1-9]KJS49944.1 MAG: hypothetical protein VR66_05510 [Peptococcaceae bacterium BRH_c23]KJS83471.1 MAG: hypothetical protein JL57_22475 [Desulfosporosinus sp. BICA1-9]HBW38268.1 hypothetical protein [Desulfosporosinus sp.]
MKFLKKGLMLLLLTIIFNVASGLLGLITDNSLIEVLFSASFILAWFFYGWHIKLGLVNGVLVGIIGSIGGIFFSFIYMSGRFGMLPPTLALWGYPFFYLIKFNSLYFAKLIFYSSVIVSVLAVAIGSEVGRVRSIKN